MKREKKVKEVEISDEDVKAEEISESMDENGIDLIERIEELEKTNSDLNDRLIRRLAEFENYKKRTDLEKSEIFKYAAESFIIKILAVYEDLQRSLSHIDEGDGDALRDGLKLVSEKFTQILDEQGVKKIDSMGKEFNHEFHEALLQQPSKEFPPNMVINEVESGYLYKDKVLKHAKVIVSQEVIDDIEEENNSEE